MKNALHIAFALLVMTIVSMTVGTASGQVLTDTAAQPNPFMTLMAAYAVEALSIAAPVLIAWFSLKLNQWFGLKREAELRDGFQIALENAAGKMVQSAKSAGQALVLGTVERNTALKQGLDYIESAAPDAIKHFGLTRDSLIEKLEAKLGLILANNLKV